MAVFFYLFPLVDVANEARESKKTQQTEDLGETDDAEGAGGAVHVSGIESRLQINYEKDVVDRDGGDKVHQEPCAQVMHADLFGVQDDVAVLSWDARSEIQDQVHEKESVGQDVKGDPGQRVLVLKEGDPPW